MSQALRVVTDQELGEHAPDQARTGMPQQPGQGRIA
jgi:hypothetical protein